MASYLTLDTSGDGLSYPCTRRQAIIWTKTDLPRIQNASQKIVENPVTRNSAFYQCLLNNTLSTLNTLTHWVREKMAAIFQTTFSNTYSWTKMYQLRLKFHWSLSRFLRARVTIFHYSVRPASHVRSVSPTVLVTSISHLYTIPSNFRRCVACKVSCKISKFWFLAIF